jgi:two-component system cell cycle response regulator DivK
MPDPARQTTSRILVVDDYDDSRTMYAEMLSFAGYGVETAKDGAEALERAGSGRFDLFVLDLALPKVDGLTVIRTLRSRPETMTVPIITLSASVGQNAHQAVRAAGADLALDKPCLPDDLVAAIRILLRRDRP